MDKIEAELGAALTALGRRERTVFAAACAQRLMPAYRAYETKQGKSGTGLVESVLEWLWLQLERDSGVDGTWEARQKEVEGLVPDEEDDLSCYAENAAAAVAYALRTAITGDSQEAIWASRQVTEALDLYLGKRTDLRFGSPEFEDHVRQHQLMRAEIGRQRVDLAEMARGALSVAAARARAAGDELSFLAG